LPSRAIQLRRLWRHYSNKKVLSAFGQTEVEQSPLFLWYVIGRNSLKHTFIDVFTTRNCWRSSAETHKNCSQLTSQFKSLKLGLNNSYSLYVDTMTTAYWTCDIWNHIQEMPRIGYLLSYLPTYEKMRNVNALKRCSFEMN
jgi:hypothetical protein